MPFTIPNDHPLGDPKHGGALFTLREIRDEIYKLVVKGRYLFLPDFDCRD